MRDHLQVNPANGSITWVMGPETVEFLCAELPQHDSVTLVLRQKQTELREAMVSKENEICPGSEQEGDCDGALLKCRECERVIGVCPPNTLPKHMRPVFNDGCPI